MKINRKDVGFRPVLIQIETEEDLKIFDRVFCTALYEDRMTEEEKGAATEIWDEITDILHHESPNEEVSINTPIDLGDIFANPVNHNHIEATWDENEEEEEDFDWGDNEEEDPDDVIF